MRIEKIKKLKSPDIFLQVDFTKGYKYIDTAGEILNLYDDNMTEYSMDRQRLIIKRPTGDIEELKISVADFWCHFTNTKEISASTTQNVVSVFSTEARRVLPVTEPAKIKRVGWRSYLLYETARLKSLNKHSAAPVTELVMRSPKVEGINHQLAVKLLERKNDETKTAILFDVDVYIEREMDIDDLYPALNEIRDFYISSALLNQINSVLAAI